jgi:hypothetical protein
VSGFILRPGRAANCGHARKSARARSARPSRPSERGGLGIRKPRVVDSIDARGEVAVPTRRIARLVPHGQPGELSGEATMAEIYMTLAGVAALVLLLYCVSKL